MRNLNMIDIYPILFWTDVYLYQSSFFNNIKKTMML